MASAAEQWKNKGNEYYSQKNWNEAIIAYTKAIDMAPSNHAYLTNRAAAYANLGQWEKSLSDAQKSLSINNQWVKGHFRSGIAFLELKRFDESISALQKACQFEPQNDELKKYLSQAEQAKRNAQPKPAPQPKPQPQQSQPQPQREQPPKAAPTTSAGKAKEEGNECFKLGKIPQAIEAYTKAINLSTDPQEKATIYSNRAACYVQLYEPVKVVADCTECLNIQPNNMKALIRRGLAYESLEKYKLGLEDLQKVLLMDPSVSVASQAVHRIKQGMK